MYTPKNVNYESPDEQNKEDFNTGLIINYQTETHLLQKRIFSIETN